MSVLRINFSRTHFLTTRGPIVLILLVLLVAIAKNLSRGFSLVCRVPGVHSSEIASLQGEPISPAQYRRICQYLRNFLAKKFPLYRPPVQKGAQYRRICQYRRNFWAKNFWRYCPPLYMFFDVLKIASKLCIMHWKFSKSIYELWLYDWLKYQQKISHSAIYLRASGIIWIRPCRRIRVENPHW